MGQGSTKEKIVRLITLDNDVELKELLKNNTAFNPNDYLNRSNDITGLSVAAMYGSLKCARVLVDLGSDVNKPEKKEGNSPLLLAAKCGPVPFIVFLLEAGADPKQRNIHDINALDMAILNGNYAVAYHFYAKDFLQPKKTMDEYLKLNHEMKYPLFNLPLFYETLMDKITPDKAPLFNIPYDRKKRFEGKVPDPNETWANFFSRIMKFELYHPPLVDANSVPLEKKNTGFMLMQSKLVEAEYGVAINLQEPVVDIEKDEVMRVDAEKIEVEPSAKRLNVNKNSSSEEYPLKDGNTGKDESKDRVEERPTKKTNERSDHLLARNDIELAGIEK